jgi:hypothetical protein
VSAGSSIDQLRINADTIANAPDAAFQYVTDAELPSHIPNIGRLAFVLERRVARYDGELREPRNLGDDILGNAVAEILLLRITT